MFKQRTVPLLDYLPSSDELSDESEDSDDDDADDDSDEDRGRLYDGVMSEGNI